MNIIFVGATLIISWKVHMPVSFIFAYARPITQRYRQKRVPLCGNTEDSLMTVRAPTIDESQWKGKWVITLHFQCYLIFTKCFKQKDSMINTSVFTAVIKSSIKPRSGTTTNRHLCSSGERYGEQKRTKVSFGRAMMQALELLWLAKRHFSGRSDVEQQRNQAHSLSGYRVTLVWRHQSVR